MMDWLTPYLPQWAMENLDLYARIFGALLKGVPMTLKLACISVALGFIFAVALALMSRSRYATVSLFARGYIFFFRGTPMLIQLFLIYAGATQFRSQFEAVNLWWFFSNAYYCAILGLTMNTAAYGAEIVRGGLQSVPHGQIEAARAAGMSRLLLYRRIIFPIAIRQALPGYSNEIILMIKDTSLVSLITMVEITMIASQLRAQTFYPILPFVCAGVLYLIINMIVIWLLSLVEHRLTRHLRPIGVSA